MGIKNIFSSIFFGSSFLLLVKPINIGAVTVESLPTNTLNIFNDVMFFLLKVEPCLIITQQSLLKQIEQSDIVYQDNQYRFLQDVLLKSYQCLNLLLIITSTL